MNESDVAFALAWSKKIRAIELLGGRCSRCGQSDPVVLDFHHTNRSEKESTVGKLFLGRWSLIEAEIKKCVLLCANCHVEHHYKGSRNGQNAQKLLLDRNISKCCECGYAGTNTASLEFHHVDPSRKRFAICEATTRKKVVSVQELADEIDKCIVICRNCHRRRHFDHAKLDRLSDLISDKMSSHTELRPAIDRDEVREMLLDGMKQCDIAEKMGVAKGTVSGVVKELGLRKYVDKSRICPACKKAFVADRKKIRFCSRVCGAKKHNVPSQEELRKLKETHSNQEIANMYGVSRIAVFYWMKGRTRQKTKNTNEADRQGTALQKRQGRKPV